MRNRTHWIESLAVIIVLALVPTGTAFGQAEQPPNPQEAEQPQDRQAEPAGEQAENQEEAENQEQEAITGISMEGTLRAVDTEQMTLLVAVDPESIMASEGESLENVPELNRDAETEADQQQAEQEGQAQEQQQQEPAETAEAETDRPLLLFHYDDQTEVVGDIQRVEGLSEQPNTRVHIDYRAEGNRAIAERIEVLGSDQQAQPEGREAEEQDEGQAN